MLQRVRALDLGVCFTSDYPKSTRSRSIAYEEKQFDGMGGVLAMAINPVLVLRQVVDRQV